MTVAEIETAITRGEPLTLECRRIKDKLPKSFWRTYSAFANTRGGLILLGVQDRAETGKSGARPDYRITGVPKAKKWTRRIWEEIGNPNVVSENVLTENDIGVTRIEGVDVIWVRVPAVSMSDKPVYCGANPFSGTYIRTREGNQLCTPAEVQSMIRDAQPVQDSSPLAGYTFADLNPDTVAEYRAAFAQLHPTHPWLHLTDMDFLRAIGAVAESEHSEEGALTRAGLLMFGRSPAVHSRFRGLEFEYIDRTNLKVGTRWSDRIADDGTWEYNLFTFVRLAFEKIMKNLPRASGRQKNPALAQTLIRDALRDAFINALIQADYDSEGHVQVVREDNAFVFRGPGVLRTPAADIYAAGCSDARNLLLRRMFSAVGYGAGIATGIPPALQPEAPGAWRLPTLDNSRDGKGTKLTLWTIPLDLPEMDERVRSAVGDKAYRSLSDAQRRVLAIAAAEGTISTERAALLTGAAPGELEDVMQSLADRQYLVKEHDGYWTLSDITEKVRHAAEPSPEAFASQSDRIIYELAKQATQITVQEILDATDIKTPQGARVAAKRLVAAGLLRGWKKGRTTYYAINASGDKDRS